MKKLWGGNNAKYFKENNWSGDTLLRRSGTHPLFVPPHLTHLLNLSLIIYRCKPGSALVRNSWSLLELETVRIDGCSSLLLTWDNATHCAVRVTAQSQSTALLGLSLYGYICSLIILTVLTPPPPLASS